MGNVAAQYAARKTWEGEAPSGMIFKGHCPTADEYAAVFGNLPPVSVKAAKDASPTVVTKASVEENNKLNAELALFCVDFPKLVRDGEDPPAEGDWLPVSTVTWADMNWIAKMVLAGGRADRDSARTAF